MMFDFIKNIFNSNNRKKPDDSSVQETPTEPCQDSENSVPDYLTINLRLDENGYIDFDFFRSDTKMNLEDMTQEDRNLLLQTVYQSADFISKVNEKLSIRPEVMLN